MTMAQQPLQPDSAPTRQSPKKGIVKRSLLVFLFLGWGASFAASVHPFFELSCHFAFHWTWGFGIVLLFCLRRWWKAWRSPSTKEVSSRRTLAVLTILSFLGLIHCLNWVRPWELYGATVQQKQENGATSPKTLRIASWNVWLSDWSSERILRTLNEMDADVVALYELNPECAEKVEAIRSKYPYSYWHPMWDPGSIVVLSRLPSTTYVAHNPAGIGMPALEISISENSTSILKILALHTKSPTPRHPSRTRARDQQLTDVAAWSVKQQGAFAVMGDLNITPWSPSFPRLLKEGELLDSRIGRGNQASWPSYLGVIAIPIDHFLHSKDVQVQKRKIQRTTFCSDHCPVVVEISLPPRDSKTDP